jgi:hypothetical protein
MSKIRHIEQTHNSLIFSGLDANPLCSISLETHIFNNLNTITMRNYQLIATCESYKFGTWKVYLFDGMTIEIHQLLNMRAECIMREEFKSNADALKYISLLPSNFTRI